MIAGTNNDLQNLADKISVESEKMGLDLNVKKTETTLKEQRVKCVEASKVSKCQRTQRYQRVLLNGTMLKQANRFVYL